MARMNDDDLLRYLNDEAQEAYQYQEEQAQDRTRSMRARRPNPSAAATGARPATARCNRSPKVPGANFSALIVPPAPRRRTCGLRTRPCRKP